MIKISELTKVYDNKVAIQDMDFCIEGNLVYGLLGPNGAGKSTLMNMITGYLSPSEGDVYVDEFSITNQRMDAQRRIGYLPELPPLYLDMKVDEYLLFCAKLKKIEKKNCKEHLELIKDLTKLEPVSNRIIGTLSKGWRQRVGVAQAIIGFPPIIILDEPSVGLDPQQIIETRRLILYLKQMKRTVIFSSHVLSEIQEVCDAVILINHGKLLVNESVKEFKNRLSGSSQLYIQTFGKTEKIVNMLQKITGVNKIVETVRNGDVLKVRMDVYDDVSVRKDIFCSFVENEEILLDLHMQEKSLESAYLKLIESK